MKSLVPSSVHVNSLSFIGLHGWGKVKVGMKDDGVYKREGLKFLILTVGV